MTKKCACGENAWFGNYCHGCRDRLLEGVSVKRQQRPARQENQAPASHQSQRSPMAGKTAENYGKREDDE